MKSQVAGTVRVAQSCGIIFGTVRKKARAPISGKPAGLSEQKSGNEKDFSRIRILHFLAGGVTGDIDIAATRIERAENVAGFPRDWLGRRKRLRCGGA
jgi:hypothetical protein